MVFPEEQLFRKNGSSGRTVFQSLHWQIVTWIKDLCIGFTHWGINFLYPIWEPFFRENHFSGRTVLPEEPFFRKNHPSGRTVLPEEQFCGSAVLLGKVPKSAVTIYKSHTLRYKLWKNGSSGRTVLLEEPFFQKNCSSSWAVIPVEPLFWKNCSSIIKIKFIIYTSVLLVETNTVGEGKKCSPNFFWTVFPKL